MENDKDFLVIERLLRCRNRFQKLNIQKLQTELSHGEYTVLKVMYLLNQEKNVPVSISLIAKRLSVSLPYISREVRGLEKRGYIVRKTDETDKRNNFVHMTQEGQEVYLRVDTCLKTFFSELGRRFGKERIEQFVRMLEEMNEIAESMLEEY